LFGDVNSIFCAALISLRKNRGIPLCEDIFLLKLGETYPYRVNMTPMPLTEKELTQFSTKKNRLPSWYLLYFLLAALDLFTVCISFGLNVRLSNDYSDSVSLNREWAGRLKVYADLATAASDVNAPGNDIFDSRDVGFEKKRLDQALKVFQTQIQAARQEILDMQSPSRARLLADFQLIDHSMQEMLSEATLIFNYFDEQRVNEAGQRMATMDRKYARVNQSIAKLSQNVRAIQQAIFEQQLANAAAMRQIEYLILILVSMMIIGSLFYGRHIAQTMKKAEQARLHVEKMKGEFISTVSHELRTPLTAIVGALGLIRSGTLGELPVPVEKLVELANRNGQRLNLLVNDLLDLEKMATGNLRMNCEIQALGPLVMQALDACQTYGNERKINLLCHDAGTVLNVNVDAGRLIQVLSNLLSNAIKFSLDGGQVEVSISRNGELVRVCVSDHGSGIPLAFRDRIFQKFSQADSSDTRAKGGSGLGLVISKELVERMGGKIGFDSVAGQGANFFIDLPIVER
jgi:signal transduction histidine kinase